MELPHRVTIRLELNVGAQSVLESSGYSGVRTELLVRADVLSFAPFTFGVELGTQAIGLLEDVHGHDYQLASDPMIRYELDVGYAF